MSINNTPRVFRVLDGLRVQIRSLRKGPSNRSTPQKGGAVGLCYNLSVVNSRQ